MYKQITKYFWSLNFLRIVWVEFQKQFVTRLRGVEFVILANPGIDILNGITLWNLFAI